MWLATTCFVLTATISGTPSARIWHVHASATGANTGGSWSDAFAELQSALAVAQDGDQIWVAKGTYLPDYDVATGFHTADREASFELILGVALYGGFLGVESTLEDRTWLFEETVLSGDIGYPDFANDNSFHVVRGSTIDDTTILDGFTIRGGRTPSTLFEKCGAGMFLESANPTISNCRFTDNVSHQNGGAICNYDSNPLILDCQFVGNQAIAYGGAIYNGGGSPRIAGCTFAENNALFGGAISNGVSSPFITECAFIGNEAHYSGGGIYDDHDSHSTITSCAFQRNLAGSGGAIAIFYRSPVRGSPTKVSMCSFRENSAYSSGGAIYVFYASAAIWNCSFAANVAFHGGGAIYNYGIGTNPNYDTKLEVSASEFYHNEVYGWGGAIDVIDTIGSIMNCRLAGNKSDFYGGGISTFGESEINIQNCILTGNNSVVHGGAVNSIYGSHPKIVGCTIVGNIAGIDGPALYAQQDTVTTISNSIIRGNLGLYPEQIADSLGSLTTVEDSNIEGGWAGDGNIDLGALFNRDASDGADGWGDNLATPFVDEGANDDFGDLRLQWGSPCINSGDPDFAPEPGESDLDGHARVLCGRVDMGAYESGIGDVNCDQSIDASDFASWPTCSDVGSVPPECVPLDFDNDGDVDLADFAAMQRLSWDQ